MFRRALLRSSPTALAAATLAAGLHAQTFTVLSKDADVIAGVGAVTAIDDLTVGDNGTWLVKVDTDFVGTGDGVVLTNTGIHSRETDAPPAMSPLTISSFGPLHIDDSGRATWNLNFAPTTANDTGIFRNQALLLREGAISSSPAFTPGTAYIGFFGACNNGANEIMVLASIEDINIATTVDRAWVRLTVDGSDNLLSETVLLKEGDSIPGLGLVVDYSTNVHDWAFNRNGEVIYTVDTDAATTSDCAIMRDTTILLREADPSAAVPGRSWATVLGWQVAQNDAGDFAFLGDLDGATTDDALICKNGTTVIAREGSSLPSIGGVFTFTSFGSGPIAIDTSGDVYWTGDWNDPVTTQDVGIFRNGDLLVQEGVTMVGASLVESIGTVQSNFAISPDGRWLVFECKLTGGVDAAVLVDLDTSSVEAFCAGDGSLVDHTTPCPCGNDATTPGNGCAHSFDAGGANLAWTGAPATDDVILQSSFTPSASFTLFMQHDSPGDAVFHDGVLCAGGTLVRLRGRNAVAGAASFPNSTFPNDATLTLSQRGGVTVGSGALRHYSAFYRNASTTFCPPATANVTNGLRIVW